MIFRTVSVIFVFLASASILVGHDIQTVDGKRYIEIRLKSKTDLGIQIAHSAGECFLDYTTILEPNRTTFGYDQRAYEIAKGDVAQRVSEPDPGRRVNYIGAGRERPKTAAPARLAKPSRLYRSPSQGFDASSNRTGNYQPIRFRGTSANGSASRTQCAATTKKGYRCSRMSEPGRAYCWQHP